MTQNKIATRYHAVLLDLDGTLADTAPDLANALNKTLVHYGKDALPFNTIRPHVSHGGRALIQLGFDFDESHADYAQTREYLLSRYIQNIAEQTQLFDGMAELLATLEVSAIPWGIVTNKPAYLTTPLIKALALDQRAACVVSGDTVAHSKPHPAPLLYACTLINVTPERCVYIGDAERDIEAGRSAGMTTLAATFGYIGANDKVEDWGAAGLIDTPMAVIDWISR